MTSDDFYNLLKSDEFNRLKLLELYNQLSCYDKEVILVSLMSLSFQYLKKQKQEKIK